ncbi:MAG: DUF4924 domain-containing protein [Cyclobacteriaceae bacterium]|nr:MAG: DUF4924 domain-containing protein [Cyclobacteriaceae bacterium]
MLIAEQKRKESISEYIIFMYQTEDLIRAYNFNLEEIYKYVIQHFPVEDGMKTRIKAWYRKVANQMKKESIMKSGHLEELNQLAIELSNFNLELLKSDQTYRKIFDQAKLHINRNSALSNGQLTNPVQICLNGIYGLLILRLNGKPVDDNIKQGAQAFGDVLSYLSFKYQKRNNGH